MKDQNHQQLVYYIARSGYYDTVKIGTTNNLPGRLKALRKKYTEDLEVLAVETDLSPNPFSLELEGERHRQFRGSRIIGEWFWATEDLKSHMAGLTEEVGVFLP